MISTESLVGLIFFCVFSILFVKNVVQDLTSAGLDWDREKWRGSVASKFIRGGEKNAVKYADEIIVLSKDVQKYFLETYGRETHFIPNGVNRPEVREAKLITDHFGLEKDSYILFLGRLVPEKGIRYLVEAFKNVKTDKKLVIAGGSSDTDSFILTHEKSSLAPPGVSLAFSLGDEGGFRWVGEYDITADEMLSGIEPQRETKTQQAKDLICALLAGGKQGAARTSTRRLWKGASPVEPSGMQNGNWAMP